MSDDYTEWMDRAWARLRVSLPPVDERMRAVSPALLRAFTERLQSAMDRDAVPEMVAALDEMKRTVDEGEP